MCACVIFYLSFQTGLVGVFPTPTTSSSNRELLAITICAADLVLIGVVMVTLPLKQMSLVYFIYVIGGRMEVGGGQ